LESCGTKKDTFDFEELAKKYAQVWNAHDVAGVAKLYADNALIYQPDLSEPMKGNKNLETAYANYFRAIPDIKIEFITIISSGDQACFEFLETGTFTGPLATPNGDIQPTGRKFEIKGAVLLKITPEGLIIEDKTYYDQASWLAQLGLTN